MSQTPSRPWLIRRSPRWPRLDDCSFEKARWHCRRAFLVLGMPHGRVGQGRPGARPHQKPHAEIPPSEVQRCQEIYGRVRAGGAGGIQSIPSNSASSQRRLGPRFNRRRTSCWRSTVTGWRSTSWFPACAGMTLYCALGGLYIRLHRQALSTPEMPGAKPVPDWPGTKT